MPSTDFHPDLRRIGRFLPKQTLSPRTLPFIRFQNRFAGRRAPSVIEVLTLPEGATVRTEPAVVVRKVREKVSTNLGFGGQALQRRLPRLGVDPRMPYEQSTTARCGSRDQRTHSSRTVRTVETDHLSARRSIRWPMASFRLPSAPISSSMEH